MTQPVNLEDSMSEDDLKKVADFREKKEQAANKISREWMAISELGMYYGWPAVLSFANNEISLESADLLIKGARKIHSGHVYDMAVANAASSSGKFEILMKPYLDDMNGVD